MNERIRELIKQADIEFDVSSDHYGIDTAVVIPYDLEKFAKLIVQECAKIVDNVQPGYGDYRDQIQEQIRDRSSQAILDYFKVN